MHLAALDEATNRLLPALEQLEASLAAKADEFEDIVKSGRTHLMDAVPGHARPGVRRLRRADPARRAARAQRAAAGRADPARRHRHRHRAQHAPGVRRQGAREAARRGTGLEIRPPEDPFEAQANRDALVELSGALKVVAVSLTKIANDLALMGSGPRAGIGEIFLPELQKGSSIMPGKVNPVMPEVVLQVAAQVIGNDTAITIGGMQGKFELNVRIPLIARNLLAVDRAADERVDGCSPRSASTASRPTSRAASARPRGRSPSATALNPFIGYDKAAAIVKEARRAADAARGRARARRRRGDARRGARPAQDRGGLEGSVMSDLERRPGSRPTRKQREQRAYRLVLAGGAAGLVAVVGMILAAVGVIGFGIPVLAAVVAVLCYVLLRRTTS